MSDSEIEESFGEIDESEYINYHKTKEIQKDKNIEINNKDIPEAKKSTHFLPFRIPHTGESKVNIYFDSLIEPRYKNDANSEEYITSFRGRIFNGKKIKVDPDNHNFSKINYTNKKGTLTIKNLEEINEYYIWKFDEEIELNNNLANMSSLLKSLDILK
jgi:hypothetical protein